MSHLQGLTPREVRCSRRRPEAFPCQLNIIFNRAESDLGFIAVEAIREHFLYDWQQRHAHSHQHSQNGFSSPRTEDLAPKHLPDFDGFAFCSVGIDKK